MTVLWIILSILAILLFIPLTIMIVSLIQLKRINKEMEQLTNIGEAWNNGVCLKDILKMPMPKSLRKDYEKMYAEDVKEYGKEVADNIHVPQPFEEFEEQT